MARKPGGYITGFDSTTAMLKSLGCCLHGERKATGDLPEAPYFFGNLLDSFPEAIRKYIYRWSGGWAATKQSDLHQVQSEDISALAVEQYPSKSYPAIMVGSSNGALTHLCAALGSPWLPQTFLLSVKRSMGADELIEDVEWGKRAAQDMINKNPDLQFHQMHDPIQDRMMVALMGYFRIKRLVLGDTYKNFITSNLPAGGTIFLSECRYQWPVTQVSERHFFQVGGLGDVSAQEYIHGSERISDFLKENGSKVSQWQIPPINRDMPEAEWGFVESLRDDVEDLAKKEGYKICRIIYDHPEDTSFFAADLYKWWYQKRGIESARLLIECFAMIEPLDVLKTRSIPLWMAFNTGNSAIVAEKYLQKEKPFEEIYMTMISNAVKGIGQVPVERWQAILQHATKKSSLLGTNPKIFPTDIGSFVRYHQDLKRFLPEEFDLFKALTIDELKQFLNENKGKYPVEFIFS